MDNTEQKLPTIQDRIEVVTSKLKQIRELKEFETKLEKFMLLLNDAPDKAVIQRRNNFDYLPISILENALDEVFLGRWQTVDFKWQQIANEIVASMTLRVYNPISGEWIDRIGAGAVQIRMVSKDSQGNKTNIVDIAEYKIKDTLGMDFPHLKSECFKNACKSLGALMGRNLNRKYTDAYTPIFTQMEAKLESNLQELLKSDDKNGQ